MYICKRCEAQIKESVPQAKVKYYRQNGNIDYEEKVCFKCKGGR